MMDTVDDRAIRLITDKLIQSNIYFKKVFDYPHLPSLASPTNKTTNEPTPIYFVTVVTFSRLLGLLKKVNQAFMLGHLYTFQGISIQILDDDLCVCIML